MKTYIVVNDQLINQTNHLEDKSDELYLLIKSLCKNEDHEIIYGQNIFYLNSNQVFCSKNHLLKYFNFSEEDLSGCLSFLRYHGEIKIDFDDDNWILIEFLILD